MRRRAQEVLPASQQQLRGLDQLGFVLYGGTAIALRLGHRTSLDFDFFPTPPLDRQALQRVIPWLAQAAVLQDQSDTLTVPSPAGGVKVFFMECCWWLHRWIRWPPNSRFCSIKA